MEKDYPIYEFKIDENGTDTGMMAISLVDEPGIESEFITFNSEKVVNKPHFIALKDEKGEYKQELFGAAIRPDIPILRKDEIGKYYYGVFTKDTIELIRNKFFKQKNTSNVNLMHDAEMTIDAYLVESFIIENEQQLEAVKSMGIDDVEIGAWMVRYKIESDELFQKIVDGEINLQGFSIEALLHRELVQASKNNFNLNKNNTIMSKFNELINKFKTILAEFEEEDSSESEENKFESAPLAEGDQTVTWTETGEAAYYVNDDGSLGDTLPDGTYELEDGRQIIIANNVVSEITEAEGDEDNEEDMNKEGENNNEKSSNESESQENMEQEDESNESESNENFESEEDESKTDYNKTLKELIPTDSDGTYSLEVFVSDGKISFGTLYSYTYKDLKFDKLIEKFEQLKQENEELKEQPASAPVFSTFKSNKKENKKSKKEFKSNLDYQLSRLGLDD